MRVNTASLDAGAKAGALGGADMGARMMTYYLVTGEGLWGAAGLYRAFSRSQRNNSGACAGPGGHGDPHDRGHGPWSVGGHPACGSNAAGRNQLVDLRSLPGRPEPR